MMRGGAEVGGRRFATLRKGIFPSCHPPLKLERRSMPGKRASTRAPPSKRGRSTKTRSTTSLLPFKQHTTTAKINANKKKNSSQVSGRGAQKILDQAAREELNKDEMELRRGLMPQQNETRAPLVVRKEAPKELAQAGGELAQALGQLEMELK